MMVAKREFGMQNPRVLVLLAMIVAAAATRLLPPLLGVWNFTGVGAICLFGGAYFRRWWTALLVPLAALLLSDILLAIFLYGLQGLSEIWMNYVLFALTTLLGRRLQGRVSFGRVTIAAIGASLMFFLISNFYVWLIGVLHYPYTPAGLVACYVLAVPFGVNMLLGNLFYSGVLFGGYELLSRQWRTPVLATADVRRQVMVGHAAQRIGPCT